MEISAAQRDNKAPYMYPSSNDPRPTHGETALETDSGTKLGQVLKQIPQVSTYFSPIAAEEKQGQNEHPDGDKGKE